MSQFITQLATCKSITLIQLMVPPRDPAPWLCWEWATQPIVLEVADSCQVWGPGRTAGRVISPVPGFLMGAWSSSFRTCSFLSLRETATGVRPHPYTKGSRAQWRRGERTMPALPLCALPTLCRTSCVASGWPCLLHRKSSLFHPEAYFGSFWVTSSCQERNLPDFVFG